MTSNARPYEMLNKRNDFVNAKTTVGTIINRPKMYNQFDIDKSNISVYNKSTKELPIDGLPLWLVFRNNHPKDSMGGCFFYFL